MFIMNKKEKYAVYGSLRRGMHNHSVLSGAKLIDVTETQDEFKMVSLGSFPAVIPGNKSVKIELYETDSPEIKKNLDRLEGYPDFYNRKKILLKNGMKAWIYILNDKDMIDDDTEHIYDWKRYYLNK